MKSGCSFGSFSNKLLGNAVRSRIAQMMSKSASASAAACSEAEGMAEPGGIDAVGQFRPVGDVEGKVEIVVENCTA